MREDGILYIANVPRGASHLLLTPVYCIFTVDCLHDPTLKSVKYGSFAVDFIYTVILRYIFIIRTKFIRTPSLNMIKILRKFDDMRLKQFYKLINRIIRLLDRPHPT